MTIEKVPACLMHVFVCPNTNKIEVGYYDKTLPVYSETNNPKLDEGGKIIFRAVREFTDLEAAETFAFEANRKK